MSVPHNPQPGYSQFPDQDAPHTTASGQPVPHRYGGTHAAPEAASQPETQPETQPEGVVDPSPALETVAAQYATNAPEGVDVETLPEFKDLRRMLPAQRVRAQMELAKLATDLPAELMAQAEDGGTVSVDLQTLRAEDLDAVVNLMETAQGLVLDNAKDPEAMEAWLVDQQDPLQAVMYAFEKYQGSLGN